ncbi:hypothetical protein SAMN05216466_106216 [Paraburkholderia phenazinium]|uniref:Uncharacterized protein n=1 Tax=Paraburkholderia phenazinium TaxID=60549 RepID=A0A1G7YK09_9BURK|nr:hypothetical protein [Paraburkholderia phenazinium]SDG96645.1 hypothetical protein SAMN05216466_106216 [Paraburkholderia phenazinium]
MTLDPVSPTRKRGRLAMTSRVDPAVHRAVTAVARLDGLTLSSWLARTVERHEDVKRQLSLQDKPAEAAGLHTLGQGIQRILGGLR